MSDRVVVGYDGSAAATEAVHWAAAEAESRHRSLRVIGSYWLPPVMDVYGIGIGAASQDNLDMLRDACAQQLSAVVANEAHSHVHTGIDCRAVSTPIVDALVSESHHAAVVVVGTNGVGAARGVLFGSVTTRVLEKSACPVVVVPAEPVPARGRVVVGIDGSAPAGAALEWAAAVAARRASELVVVHAWKYPYKLTAEGLGRGGDATQVDAAIELERSVERARDLTPSGVVAQLVEASATEALVDASATADLVVVGSRGRGGFRSMMLGSVALAVAGHAVCPVAVVR